MPAPEVESLRRAVQATKALIARQPAPSTLADELAAAEEHAAAAAQRTTTARGAQGGAP